MRDGRRHPTQAFCLLRLAQPGSQALAFLFGSGALQNQSDPMSSPSACRCPNGRSGERLAAGQDHYAQHLLASQHRQPGRRLDLQFGELRVHPRVGARRSRPAPAPDRRSPPLRGCPRRRRRAARSAPRATRSPRVPELPGPAGCSTATMSAANISERARTTRSTTTATGAGSLRMADSRLRRVVSRMAVRYSASGTSLIRRSGPPYAYPAVPRPDQQGHRRQRRVVRPENTGRTCELRAAVEPEASAPLTCRGLQSLRLFGGPSAEDHRPCRAAEGQQDPGAGLGFERRSDHLIRRRRAGCRPIRP